MIQHPLELCVGGYYAISIICILLIKYIKPLNNLLKYGKTYNTTGSNANRIIEFLTTLTVPKRWFLHFYVIFFGCCFANGCLLTALRTCPRFNAMFTTFVSYWCPSILTFSPGYKHYKIIFYILFVQSFRRLLESLLVTRFSPASKINVSHYIIGILFYVTISFNSLMSLIPYYINFADFAIKTDIIDKLLIVFFGLVSLDQIQNHYHLSTLKKYSIPTFRLFNIVGSPHYLDEILIYLTVAIFSNLDHSSTLIDLNFVLAWVFVLVNLSISSLESFVYYKTRFSQFSASYSIIPGVL